MLDEDAVFEVSDVGREVGDEAVHALEEPVEPLEQMNVVLLQLLVELLQLLALLHPALELLRRPEVAEVGLDELAVLGGVRSRRRPPVHGRNDILEPEELGDGGVAL